MLVVALSGKEIRMPKDRRFAPAPEGYRASQKTDGRKLGSRMENHCFVNSVGFLWSRILE